jgi:Protein of unknown function (DUF1592)/Protein of unknown function (DUF1588)/Protein of unknown function (DUF1595)/Protein of unknown function (DUF1585)
MRVPPGPICTTMTALTALVGLAGIGCGATYVVGRNPAGSDAGGSVAPTTDAGGTRGTGGGLGGVGASGGGGRPDPSGAAGASGGPGAGGGSPGGASGGSFVNPPAPDGTPTPESAGTMALQRLTLVELSNTLNDLLGLGASPGTVNPILAGVGFSDDVASDNGFLAPGTFSPQQTQALLSAAEQLTTPLGASVSLPCNDPAAGAETTVCATTFIATFGRRAFRRPVTAEESSALLALFNTAIGFGFDFTGSIAQVVRGMLQSPNFLYHWEVGDATPSLVGGLITLTPYQVASRLSYLLWQTMPDDTLLTAADNNQLSTPAQIVAQAQRMLADPRSYAGLANFHRQWLRIGALNSLQKDPTLFPTYTPAVGFTSGAITSAFGPELTTFVSADLSLVGSPAGDGTLKTLLTAPYTYQSNGAAEAIYGPDVAAPGAPLQLNPAQRAGILTQTAFLATNATATRTDPVARGVAVWQQLLCGPSIASHPAFVMATLDPTRTNRQIYAQQDSPTGCATCHQSFDPLGFAFETYNAIGAYQTTDSGQPIDASGATVTPGGTRISFQNAIDLVNVLAANDEVKWCVTRQWFRFVLGRLESPSDEGSMELAYRAGAVIPGFSIRQMLMSLVQTQDFRFRAPSPGEM